MNSNYKNPMLDSEFLNQLAAEKERVIYAKVVALDMDENPIEEIQGRVTQGSVPVDGNSAVRRTCSLTMVAQELNINDYIWGVKTKIQLYIGQDNKINKNYPPIIWFKKGVFILTSFSSSVSASGFTVSLQGKDKMCLLNGDVGGNVTSLSFNWGEIKVTNKHGYTSTEQIPLKRIIKKAVHEYAGDPWHNIILNDLDDCGLELLEYRGEDPLYFIYNAQTQEASNMTINPNQEYFYKSGNQYKKISIGEMEAKNAESDSDVFIFRTLADLNENNPSATIFYGFGDDDNTPNTSIEYNLIKIEQGMTCGYRTCELVYAGTLTSSVNETITSMLDKIVKMLGNYEYFYNIDGQFVFQKKRTYVNTSWNNMVNNGEEEWVENAAYTASYLFSFEDGSLITSYQNAPNLSNLKNDFSIWGTKKGVSGKDIAIHMRFAIDVKPTYYTSLYGVTYTTKSKEEVEYDRVNSEYEIGQNGYQKESSRFGLSEDWWEVRDWANAWEYSNLGVPTGNLGVYCPTRAIVYDESEGAPSNTGGYKLVPIAHETWVSWGLQSGYKTTDDLIFNKDGKWIGSHGSCAHSYTWWLSAFKEDGRYGPDCYAYFYKPQVPESEVTNGGAGLILGDKIEYNCDWRELIYRMAYDFKRFEDLDQPRENPEEPKVYRDNFLVSIKQNNPNWYPTGYTGYEQYYTDMYEFWRELYDPEYTTSYDVVSLTAKRFLEQARYTEYFYDAPVYEQCKMEDPFFSSVMYYLKDKNGEYIAQTGLLQSVYGLNPTQYYYISKTEIKPVPMITDTYDANKYYVKETASGYNKANVNASNYNSQVLELSVRNATYGYQPCAIVEPFNKTKLYFVQYIANEETQEVDYKVDQTVTEDLYLKTPGKYYTRKIAAGSIEFVNCVKIMDFDKKKEYFKRKHNEETDTYSYTPVSFTEKEYSTITHEDEYYYAVISYSYRPCVHPKYDFDVNNTYYVEGIKEYELNPESPNYHWNKNVVDSPESLIFWFDFLDTDGELSQYSVARVGDRPKAVNDTKVKAIYFRETPQVIFVDNLNRVKEKKSGYTYAQLPTHMEYLFHISSQNKSAKDVLDNYLYSYSYCTESITLSAIPVYHLEPNTRIFVRDDRCGINGEYIVSRISFPLAANGTMSINATKVVDRIY